MINNYQRLSYYTQAKHEAREALIYRFLLWLKPLPIYAMLAMIMAITIYLSLFN